MTATNDTDPTMDARVAQQPLPGAGVSGPADSDRAQIPNGRDFVTNRKTLYNFIRAGLLPGVRRICGRITIHRPTVIEWYRTGQGAVPRSRSKS